MVQSEEREAGRDGPEQSQKASDRVEDRGSRHGIARMTVADVRALVAGAPPEPGDEFWKALESDPRKGVRAILERLLRARSRRAAQRHRETSMRALEADVWGAGCLLVAGVDEAGRGPLAGPVVAAAVILPRDFEVGEIDDSKKLTPDKRDLLFDRIRNEARAVGVGSASRERIDEINILHATFEAMRGAVAALDDAPGHVLVDGEAVPGLGLPQTGVPRGDERSAAIAAASIVAKVTRDRIMIGLDAEYPEYGFARHKGYGTPEHLAALARFGPCEIHRRSFHVVRESEGGLSELYALFRSELLGSEDTETLDAVARSIAAEKEKLDSYELGRLRGLYRRCYVRLAAGLAPR